MIRRNILRHDRDQRVVRWSLVAAGFALSVGFYAQGELRANAHRSVAEKTAEAPAVVADEDQPLLVEGAPAVTKARTIPAGKG
jgi:hypothetical protein